MSAISQPIKHIKSFALTIKKLVKFAAANHPKLLLLIATLDCICATAKLSVVILVALFIRVISSDVPFILYGIHLSPSIKSILNFAVAIAIAALIAAITDYYSIYYSRKLGRSTNQEAMRLVRKVLAQKPLDAADVKFKPPANLNILLTQLPLHTGLAFETLARMNNPILLMFISCGFLIYQKPIFAAGVIAVTLITLPILLKLGLVFNVMQRHSIVTMRLN